MGISGTRARLLAAMVTTAAGGLAAYHAAQLWSGAITGLQLIMAFSFAWLCFTAVVPYLHRDVRQPTCGPSRRTLDRLRLTVIVPVHNEDPEMFLAMLESVTRQSRLPQRLHVVENGDPSHGYEPKLERVFAAWRHTRCPPVVEAAYSFRPVASKRHAQGFAIEADRDADVYATVDSDVRLHPEALARGLAPFRDRRVMSVGGLLVGANTRRNLLTRLVELGYAGAFLNGRAAWSLLGCVGVHCGALAMYRGKVLRRYLGHYLTHTVAGRYMTYGDDAMATRYSLLEGRSVIQLGCLGYTLHPVNLGHLTRQRLRWWRSWFWGNLWLLRVFSPRQVIWWLTAASFVRFALYTTALVVILVVGPIETGVAPWLFAAWLAAVAYLSGVRYLTLRHPDQTFGARLATFALAPFSSLLNLYLCSVLQVWGLVTCLKTGWSTRAAVEVGLQPTGSDPGDRHGSTASASAPVR